MSSMRRERAVVSSKIGREVRDEEKLALFSRKVSQYCIAFSSSLSWNEGVEKEGGLLDKAWSVLSNEFFFQSRSYINSITTNKFIWTAKAFHEIKHTIYGTLEINKIIIDRNDFRIKIIMKKRDLGNAGGSKLSKRVTRGVWITFTNLRLQQDNRTQNLFKVENDIGR